MNSRTLRAPRLARPMLIGTLTLLAIGLAALLGPRASAQTEPGNNAGINLVNQSGEGAHLWLGHSGAPDAWVLAGQSGYWFMTLKGERDFPGGPWNYNDKVRVNALRKGAPKDQTVTREFVVRGHASNMRATWDGSTLQFAASYAPGESPSGAGGAGTTTSGGSTGGAAGGNGNGVSSGGDLGPWPLSPEATVEALTASVIAMITGLVASNLAAAGAAVAVGGAEGGEATTPAAPISDGPLDSGLRDPHTGETVVAWEPGKYTDESGGKAGDVWYGGQWQSGEAVAAQFAAAELKATQDQQADQEARNKRYEDEGRARNEQLDREAHARQLEADAAARAERDRLANNLGVAREEAKLAVQQTIKSEMARNSADAERFNQWANRANVAANAGILIRTGADAGVDILGDHTGPLGKAINMGYTLTRTAAEKLAEGQSLQEAAKEGLSAVVIDQIKGKIVGAVGLNTHMDRRSFATADASVKTFMKTLTQPRAWTKRAVANWALGEGVKVPIEQGFESLGLKKPDA